MKYFLCLLFIPLFLSCQSQDCSQFREKFSSYQQAETQVRKATIKIQESVNTSKSSWIRGASYFSCDGKTGFFILKTDKQAYTYQNMPIEIWKGFKNAESFESYYIIKGKGYLIL